MLGFERVKSSNGDLLRGYSTSDLKYPVLIDLLYRKWSITWSVQFWLQLVSVLSDQVTYTIRMSYSFSVFTLIGILDSGSFATRDFFPICLKGMLSQIACPCHK